MGTVRKHYTSGEIALIARLRAQGFGWRIIAERTGRSAVSIRQARRRAKKPVDIRHAENEALIAEFEAGKTMVEIAQARGWSQERVCMRMTRAGYDAEMRFLTRPSPKSRAFPAGAA